MRRIAGRTVEISQRNAAYRAVRVDGFHHGIEQLHGDGHVARMRGDAGCTCADNGVLAAKTFKGGATAAGIAFIAGLIGVVKIGAAGALKQVTGGGGLIA
ncbi:hypothetical protein D3C80_1830660 [compost metagenome]